MLFDAQSISILVAYGLARRCVWIGMLFDT